MPAHRIPITLDRELVKEIDRGEIRALPLEKAFKGVTDMKQARAVAVK